MRLEQWSNVDVQKTLTENLPSDVSKRKVRLSFLNHHDQKAIINRMNIYIYNESLSLHENCLRFLEIIEKESKYVLLWNLVK